MTITHIFFDVYGVLIDSHTMSSCYAGQLGEILSVQYGGLASEWSNAYRSILADWDSYYADLDLDGDEGIQDMWEGIFRTTRALFRLAGVAEPDTQALSALSRQLPYDAALNCDAGYPDSKPVMSELLRSGYVLGVATNLTMNQVRGVLTGAGILDCINGQILCPEVTGRFTHDPLFFAQIDSPAQESLVISASGSGLSAAHSAGLRTLHLLRGDGVSHPPADFTLCSDLSGLQDYLVAL